MSGTASPGADGPTFGPPNMPPGWIAQWDGASKKYYFVQLATGVSQWETPTDAAPIGPGSTPADKLDHPYGVPGGGSQVITHPDGTQTVKHADGTMEPILPPGAGGPEDDGTRGLDGPVGERGIGQFAMNALLNQRPNQGGGGGGGGMMGQLAGGLMHGGQGAAHSSGGIGGKIAGTLVNSFLHSDKPQQTQNYYGGPPPQNQGGFGGMVGNLFGGSHHQNQGGQNYGYSNSGQSGGYSGQAPPSSYAASTGSYTAPPQSTGNTQYQSPPPNQPVPGSFASPAQSGQFGQSGPSQIPSYAPPPQQRYGQQQQQPYYQPPQQHQQPAYGSAPGGYNPPYANIPPPPSSNGQPGYEGYGSSGGGPPPIPHGTHPHAGGQGYGNPQY